MTIACKKCAHLVTSLIIDKELAMKEIMDVMGKHCMRQHHKEMEQLRINLAKLQMATMFFVTMSEFAMVPESEEFIATKLEESQKIMMLAAGFDPVEDDEEYEDEEGDDEVEEVEVPHVEEMGNLDDYEQVKETEQHVDAK